MVNATHRRPVARHATVKRAKTGVSPANKLRTGSPAVHRYQIATEHQAPINKMAIARTAKPIQRASRLRSGFISEAPQHDRLRACSPWTGFCQMEQQDAAHFT